MGLTLSRMKIVSAAHLLTSKISRDQNNKFHGGKNFHKDNRDLHENQEIGQQT